MRGSLRSESVLAVPSSMTIEPSTASWRTPGLATGALLVMEATTIKLTGALSSLPSLTTSVAR